MPIGIVVIIKNAGRSLRSNRLPNVPEEAESERQWHTTLRGQPQSVGYELEGVEHRPSLTTTTTGRTWMAQIQAASTTPATNSTAALPAAISAASQTAAPVRGQATTPLDDLVPPCTKMFQLAKAHRTAPGPT
jgi:hypothetical protein